MLLCYVQNICQVMVDDLLFACRCCGAETKEKHRREDFSEPCDTQPRVSLYGDYNGADSQLLRQNKV